MDVQRDHGQELADAMPVASEETLLRRIERHIFRRVASGFLVLVPVLVTFLILALGFREADRIFRPLAQDTLLNFTGVGVAVFLLMLYIVGSFFSGKRSQAWQDAVLSRIPVVRTIYGVARQATEGLTSATGQHFSRVVMVQWPRHGVHTMGFVTGHYAHVDEERDTIVAVYIPTVPNPTSGNLAFFSEDDIVETSVTVQDAMKMIFSGGVVLPVLPERGKLWADRRAEEKLKSQ